MDLLLIVAGFLVIIALLAGMCMAYVKHVYSRASEGIIGLANTLHTRQVSLSFMIPQASSDQYVEQVLKTIENVGLINQSRVFIVLRVKSLGRTPD